MWARWADFQTNDQGAVSTDWMVLSVSLIFLVGFVIAMMRAGTTDLAHDMSSRMASAHVVLLNVDHMPD